MVRSDLIGWEHSSGSMETLNLLILQVGVVGIRETPPPQPSSRFHKNQHFRKISRRPADCDRSQGRDGAFIVAFSQHGGHRTPVANTSRLTAPNAASRRFGANTATSI